MRTTFRNTLTELGMFGDLLICGVSLLLASALSQRPLWERTTLSLNHPTRVILLTGLLGACWHLSLISTKAYRSYRAVRFEQQAIALAKGTTLASFWVLVWYLASPWQVRFEPIMLVLHVTIFWVLTFTGLVVTRICARAITRFLRKRGRNLRNVLIVGTNRRAILLAEWLEKSTELGYLIAGFVDEYWHQEDAPERYKNMLLGGSQAFLRLIRTMTIDEVIIALPIASNYHLAQEIVDACRKQGIPVRSDGRLFDSLHQDLLNPYVPAELITHHEHRHPEWMVVSKRLLDFITSGIALVILSPLMLVIALVIKADSSGPAFFSQERLGLNKRRFRIWKFRTMVVRAEALMAQVEHLNETQGPTFKLARDPRITKVGGLLRKTSLDELPQLFNVLLGHMSLVGPRPLPLRDYEGFTADWHRRRFSVKPGITCLWQIQGRSSISFDRWMELDMDYIDRWSLSLDLEILIKTIPAVLKGSGAV